MWAKIIYTGVALAYAAGAYWLLNDYCEDNQWTSMCSHGAGASW